MNNLAALQNLQQQLEEAVQKVYKLQGAIDVVKQLIAADQQEAVEETTTEETTTEE